MKIAFIAIKGVDIIGGIETYTVELGKRLVRSGHEVIVYCIKTPEYPTPFRQDGVLFYPLPTIHHKYLEKIVLVFMASLHQFKVPELDIVHYHAIGPSIFSFIPRLAGRKTIFQSHGHEWERSSWNIIAKTFFHISEKLTFIFANDASAVSKNLKYYYEEKYKKSVTYIPSGISPKKPLSASKILRHGVKKSEYFLYVGRLSQEKNIEELISAYIGLEDTPVKLIIVGKERPEDTDYVTKLKTLAGSNKNILFVGPAYDDELVEWYSNALAYILPSRIEGLPITLLEAMSFSCCCIASDIPANTEALDNKGLTYPLNDHKALQQQLEYVTKHVAKRQLIGRNLLAHAYKNYTWSFISDEFIKLYSTNLSIKYKGTVA
ncbi:MAG: Alpha-D-GlcNAc alpha-1,2-L-rhamnosyltransferase (EC [uncultured Thiotrichaceae bacterium]|uniref:Alpha-D-GlcNAc alpha-1,2-L-rhamnosyltransferase (EC) n=1 Tax=uncultured Thiotrichaceae bacterium TaxID=298394 RepID=A0A6S6TPN4_9GAMM|nr:MAG: Alpha-D-GlcNAc alpha-1,2-L-rhamnosyltransferase (EC [uncultured Thiotrichaceae bacterium]